MIGSKLKSAPIKNGKSIILLTLQMYIKMFRFLGESPSECHSTLVVKKERIKPNTKILHMIHSKDIRPFQTIAKTESTFSSFLGGGAEERLPDKSSRSPTPSVRVVVVWTENSSFETRCKVQMLFPWNGVENPI